MRRLAWIESALIAYFRAGRALLPAGYATPPLFVYFFLTYDCDAACPFCFERGGPPPAKAYLPATTVESVLAQVPRRATVSFSGGEPLLHPDLFALLESTARTRTVSLVTNGLGLDGDAVRRLVGLVPSRMGRPGLSVLGISLLESLRDAGTGAAVERKRETLRAVRDAKRRAGTKWPLVDLKLVIRDDNVARMDLGLEWVHEGLADMVTYQVENDLLLTLYHDGRFPEVSQAEAWRATRSGWPPRIADLETLRKQVRAIRTSAEARAGRVRFYPALTEDEILRYYSGRPLEDAYRCVMPWSSLFVSPLGNACQCRNPRSEPLVGSSVADVWNGENFRAFRVAAKATNVGAACAGCCFLKPVRKR
jgi:hypothetical protein